MHSTNPEILRFLKRAARQGSWPLLQRYSVFPRIIEQPPVECAKTSDFAVHVLVCEKDATMLHWCLRSLLQCATSPFRLYVHDDGSCRAETLDRLRRSFVNAEVLQRDRASAVVEPRIVDSPELVQWRREDYIAAKCLDFYLIGDEEWVIILDGDVLFFTDPTEIFERSQFAIWMQDCFYSPYIEPDEAEKLFGWRPMPVSGGLGRMRRESADLKLLQEVLRFKAQPHIHARARQRGLPRLEDQTYHALLAGRQPQSRFLPASYQVALEPGLQGIIAKHYTTPARFLLFEEGIPRVAQHLSMNLPRWLSERG